MLRPLNSSGVPHVGNDRFEGYCADLAEKLFDIIHVDYKIEPVKDGKYGSMTKTGSWNGMVGELVRGVSGHDNTQVRGLARVKIAFSEIWISIIKITRLQRDMPVLVYYRQTSNISRTLVGNTIVDHSDRLSAPVGAAQTISPFSTWYLASKDCTKTIGRRVLVFGATYIRYLTVYENMVMVNFFFSLVKAVFMYIRDTSLDGGSFY